MATGFVACTLASELSDHATHCCFASGQCAVNPGHTLGPAVPLASGADAGLGLRAGGVVCLNFNFVVVHGKPGTIVPLLIRTPAGADLAVNGHAFARVARQSSMESAGITFCRVGGSNFA